MASSADGQCRSTIHLQIVNPDSPFHTDGGGWHQPAIPQLGIDAKAAPRSEKTFEITASAPGEYASIVTCLRRWSTASIRARSRCC
jgi:hypothetical protein